MEINKGTYLASGHWYRFDVIIYYDEIQISNNVSIQTRTNKKSNNDV